MMRRFGSVHVVVTVQVGQFVDLGILREHLLDPRILRFHRHRLEFVASFVPPRPWCSFRMGVPTDEPVSTAAPKIVSCEGAWAATMRLSPESVKES